MYYRKVCLLHKARFSENGYPLCSWNVKQEGNEIDLSRSKGDFIICLFTVTVCNITYLALCYTYHIKIFICWQILKDNVYLMAQIINAKNKMKQMLEKKVFFSHYHHLWNLLSHLHSTWKSNLSEREFFSQTWNNSVWQCVISWISCQLSSSTAWLSVTVKLSHAVNHCRCQTWPSSH